jgi:hypothetical protein
MENTADSAAGDEQVRNIATMAPMANFISLFQIKET